MAKAKKAKQKKFKSKYACTDCGTEVVMDCCGVGFRRLVCCDKVMVRK